MFIFQSLRNLIEIVVNVSGHDLRVALRLGDIRVSKHLTDVFNGYSMTQHPCGEGVAGHVTMLWPLNAAGHTESLQA